MSCLTMSMPPEISYFENHHPKMPVAKSFEAANEERSTTMFSFSIKSIPSSKSYLNGAQN